MLKLEIAPYVLLVNVILNKIKYKKIDNFP